MAEQDKEQQSGQNSESGSKKSLQFIATLMAIAITLVAIGYIGIGFIERIDAKELYVSDMEVGDFGWTWASALSLDENRQLYILEERAEFNPLDESPFASRWAFAYIRKASTGFEVEFFVEGEIRPTFSVNTALSGTDYKERYTPIKKFRVGNESFIAPNSDAVEVPFAFISDVMLENMRVGEVGCMFDFRKDGVMVDRDMRMYLSRDLLVSGAPRNKLTERAECSRDSDLLRIERTQDGFQVEILRSDATPLWSVSDVNLGEEYFQVVQLNYLADAYTHRIFGEIQRVYEINIVPKGVGSARVPSRFLSGVPVSRLAQGEYGLIPHDAIVLDEERRMFIISGVTTLGMNVPEFDDNNANVEDDANKEALLIIRREENGYAVYTNEWRDYSSVEKYRWNRIAGQLTGEVGFLPIHSFSLLDQEVARSNDDNAVQVPKRFATAMTIH